MSDTKQAVGDAAPPDTRALFDAMGAQFKAAAAALAPHDRDALALILLTLPFELLLGGWPDLIAAHAMLGLNPLETGFFTWEAVGQVVGALYFGREGL